MKKIVIILILLLLVGCSNNSLVDEESARDKYFTYYQSILDAKELLSDSDYFDISAVVNADENDEYHYSVIVDNPQIAMYNIEVMAVVDDGSLSINRETVMPTSGILDDSYNMIPYQVSLVNNYAEGIVLDGTIDTDSVKLIVLVMWKNSDLSVTNRQFFELEAAITE